MDIIIQIIGALGIIANVISFQCKKHNHILLFKTLNELLFAVQYFLLGAYTGTAMNVVGCVRNVIFARQVEKNKKTMVGVIVFSVIFTVSGIILWGGPKSILIIFAKIVSTLAYGNKNTSLVRILCFITSACWLVYNACVFSVAGVLCEAFTIVSISVGIIRLDIIPRIKKSKGEQ